MLQIVYEQEPIEAADGTVHVELPPITGRIAVSSESARRCANGYLARHVGVVMAAGEPALVWQDAPVWRMPIYLHLSGFEYIARLGEIDVSALRREVLPLSAEMIETIQTQADAIATRFTSSAT